MAKTAQQVYEEIDGYIKEHGGIYSKWYCGIAYNYKNRLFNEHKLPGKEYQWWIARECDSNIGARNVEDALHKLGCDGGPGGGDASTVWVYAYLKGTMTEP